MGDPRDVAGSTARDPKLDDAAWQAHLVETRSSLGDREWNRGFALMDLDLPEKLYPIDFAVRR